MGTRSEENLNAVRRDGSMSKCPHLRGYGDAQRREPERR